MPTKFKKLLMAALGAAASGPAADADAVAWAAAVVAAGGSYSANTLSAVSNFITAAKAHAYWNDLDRVNLNCGTQLTAALIPQKGAGVAGNAADVGMNMVAGDYSESIGIITNGFTKYLKTGFIVPTSDTAPSTHMGLYQRGGSGLHADMGAVNGGGGNYLELVVWSNNNCTSLQYHSSGATGSRALRGFVVGTRLSTSDHQIYVDGASAGSEVGTVTVLGPALEVFVGAINGNGTATVSNANFAGYTIGKGLTPAKVAAFTTDMEAFQTALGRNV